MEASSHGLDQKRLDGVRLAAVGFTNLRRDHLDYHPSVEAYCAAKLRLFRELAPDGAGAVVNADGEFAKRFETAARERGLRLLSIGVAGRDLVLAETRREGFEQTLIVQSAGRTHRVRLPLIGDYQASNALVAAGLAIVCGLETDAALGAIGTLTGVSGRLEIIGRAKGGLAVVDYAHKPDALEAALAAVRPFVSGKLICVFGCGGDRDRGKRPIMGAIARRAADVAIVTDDNPRSEDPAAIRAEILSGAPGAREIGDRSEAIREGVRLLAAGDVLIVAGKGHETGQIVGDRTLPFSDQDAVRAELTEYQ
jgi:UDP-N-acetylmuramoyl-L-alanyl-D-glutamate--2,6-diaminopimelate ligase